jgi:secretion/DNA translocation related TadE-like protein
VLAALLVVCLGLGAVGVAVLGRHRAQAGADLAALAGAAALPAGVESACTRARDLVRSMHAALTRCEREALDLVVTVDVTVQLGRWRLGPARAGARAGPVSP